MVYISHCAVNTATAIISQTHNRKPHIPQRISSVLSTISADDLERASVTVWPTEEESRSDCE